MDRASYVKTDGGLDLTRRTLAIFSSSSARIPSSGFGDSNIARPGASCCFRLSCSALLMAADLSKGNTAWAGCALTC